MAKSMPGGSNNHRCITVRFMALFANHLEGSTCERDPAMTQDITYPCLIVEVLSASTEVYVRYPTLATVRYIVKKANRELVCDDRLKRQPNLHPRRVFCLGS
jgi:hypothetical protein